jgi:hypothetical protein
MGTRSELSPTRHITPAAVAHQFDKILQDMEALRQHMKNHIVAGGILKAPTNASTQATGAAGVTDWNIDIEACVVCVDGVVAHFAAQADFDIHSGTVYPSLTSGNSAYAALVVKNVSGTLSQVAIGGTATTDGDEVAPTDAEIEAGVVAGNAWVKLGETLLRRTADQTLVQTYDSTKRSVLGVNVDTAFGDWSSIV